MLGYNGFLVFQKIATLNDERQIYDYLLQKQTAANLIISRNHQDLHILFNFAETIFKLNGNKSYKVNSNINFHLCTYHIIHTTVHNYKVLRIHIIIKHVRGIKQNISYYKYVLLQRT